jgi:hypothetical protein
MDDASLLGYPREWIELGLLERPLLADQLQRFHAGEDPNTEHYRYAAFQRLLRRRQWTDELIDQYVRLVELDPDRTMATSALCALFDHPALTNEQLLRLERAAVGCPVREKRYRRARAGRC